MRLETFVPEEPGKDEVAIAVKFAALNPIDWKVRSGMMKIVTGRSFPRGMGLDFAGIVTAVGSEVDGVSVGDAVFGMARFKEAGAFGETVIAKASAIGLKPDSLSFEEAACLVTPGVTAWNALVDKAGVKAGQSVFVAGCGGAVGESALQIGRMFGAELSGSCGAYAMDRARSFGLVNVYDYRKTELSALEETYDIVFDAAGTLSTATGLGMLRKGGTFATVNPTPLRFLRAVFDRRLKPIVGSPRAELMDQLAAAATEKRLNLPIAKIVSLQKAIPFIKEVESGRRLDGKAVIAID